MTDLESRLLQVLKTRSFRTGTFRLASGDTSNYYIDGKMTEVSGEGAYLIGEVLRERTEDLDFQAIGGLEAGAIPLTTAAVIAYHRVGRPIEGFWVREKEKAHGTRKMVEGGLAPNSRVVVVEDVVTRGTSALKAIRAVREMGCEVLRVLTIVDRLQGAAELYRAEGIEDYQAVFSIEQFGVQVVRANPAEATS